MSCTGSESSLLECDFEWGKEICSKDEDVYLECTGVPAFKLYGGDSADRVRFTEYFQYASLQLKKLI